MKDALKIFKRDIKNVFSNYGALIVALALCILPSLYAWFNIKASWDPYSEAATSGIKVGVVNKDIGATLKGKDINLGQKVVDELKDNKQMGWQFVNEEEAQKMVEEGKYYASITIPENFSSDLTSIVTEDVKKGDIIYTVNEKINAIAPKLTDKGATGVQEKISKAIVETVSSAIFGAGNELGIELENQLPKISQVYNALIEVQSQFDNINEVVDLTATGAEKIKVLIEQIQGDVPKIEETIKSAKVLATSVKEFLTTSKDGINNIAPIIKQDIGIISEISNNVANSTGALIDAINSGSDKAPQIVQNLISKVSSIEKTTNGLIKVLQAINKIGPGNNLDRIINNLVNVNQNVNKLLTILNDINSKLINGEKIDTGTLNNLETLANNISNITTDIYNNFDDKIVAEINNIFSQAYNVADKTLSILNDAENKLPQAVDILNTAYNSADKGIQGIEFVKKNLPQAEEMINELVDKMKNIQDSADLKEIIDLLKYDVQKRSEFLTNPVNIIENKMFPMGNYGTSMTPFYTVLSLWVGLLLLTSIFTAEVHGDFKSYSKYFGKLMLFLCIAIIQAIIVSIGDLYLLKIYCSNPLLFVLGSIFTSIVFTFIVYSLVSVFGSVGKVIGIILLVLQVAGSGGTFPIQLTPKFFQALYPFLPFTYAISFAREAIGGVVESVLVRDIEILILYIIIFILLAVFLKKPINKASEGFVNSFKKSGLGE